MNANAAAALSPLDRALARAAVHATSELVCQSLAAHARTLPAREALAAHEFLAKMRLDRAAFAAGIDAALVFPVWGAASARARNEHMRACSVHANLA